MGKVTSKLQLTVPKAIADRYRIRPGDELEWTPAGDTVRVTPARKVAAHERSRSVGDRLRLFRKMLERQRQREANPEDAEDGSERPRKRHEVERGWRREDLYTRGRTR